MSLIQAFTLFLVMVSLAALPSSSVALVVARSVTAGVANGIAVAVGIVLGDLLFVLLAILGLTAIAELMGGFFAILKVAGGLYLIWLGMSLLKARGGQVALKESANDKNGLFVSLSAGFLLTFGDIKAIIFYASLFPLFLDLNSASAFDHTLLVCITILSVGSVKVLYAIFASKAAGSIQNKQLGSVSKNIAGSLLVGVGGYVAFKA